MEAILRPFTWAEWPESFRSLFQQFRSDAGEALVLDNNVFVEQVLPAVILRKLEDAEMAACRAPYLESGESRRPTLTWPRELPIEGEPADTVAIVEAFGAWFAESVVPKLFINAEPGAILVGAIRDFCRTFPNQQETTVAGAHFIQEDAPDELGTALATGIEGL